MKRKASFSLYEKKIYSGPGFRDMPETCITKCHIGALFINYHYYYYLHFEVGRYVNY